MQDRKKIYSEQLLQIHTDSKKRNPGKEIYARISWICRIKMQSLQGGLGTCGSRHGTRAEGRAETL